MADEGGKKGGFRPLAEEDDSDVDAGVGGQYWSPYIRNTVHMSLCFFLVFTAFSAIQNLEASIVGGHCKDCDVYCDGASETCLNGRFSPSDVDKNSVTCSWTSPTSGRKFCANEGGNCKNVCPNDDGGDAVRVIDNALNGTGDVSGDAPEDEDPFPVFDSCSASTNVGSVAIGILYSAFTLCCLIGPYIVDIISPKWAVSLAFSLFTTFCAANTIVAKFPSVIGLQWGLLVPTAALVGFAASFLWTAQGTYITTNAFLYARSTGAADQTSSLGLFNGIFWCFFQFTQISGNLAQSLLLNQAGWSNTALMIFYLIFAGTGLALSVLLTNVTDDDSGEGGEADGELAVGVQQSKDTGLGVSDDSTGGRDTAPRRRATVTSRGSAATSVSRSFSHGIMGPGGPRPATAATSQRTAKPLGESLRGVVNIWTDRRMQCLIPLIMYSGLEMGFIWGDFTSNWVKPSVGTSYIGYVMAAFGAADVLSSFMMGKLSDIVGRTPIVLLGSASHLAVLITLYKIQVDTCDNKWGLLIACACVWGVGDACFNTQIGALLGEYFPTRKEDAFSNLKLWQSLMTSVAFFLNLDSSLMSSLGTLRLVLSFCCIGTASFILGTIINRDTDKEEVERLQTPEEAR